MAARTGSGRSQTRQKVLEATVATLAALGFSRTTARAVATAGGFAPGGIYYHFESLDDLFVAAARYTSAERLARYRERTAGVSSATGLIDRLRELYEEDQSSGHVAGGKGFWARVPLRELATAAFGPYLWLVILARICASRSPPDALFNAARPAAA